MPAFFEDSNRRSRFGTTRRSVTASPTADQAAPFGLMKSIWGSITTKAVRSRSSVILGTGIAGLAGSVYCAGCAVAVVMLATATASAAVQRRAARAGRRYSGFLNG